MLLLNTRTDLMDPFTNIIVEGRCLAVKLSAKFPKETLGDIHSDIRLCFYASPNRVSFDGFRDPIESIFV